MRGVRGQSDTVGVVLLTAVVVVLSAMIGAFLLGDFDEGGQTEPTVDVFSDLDGQTIVIEHRGGDSYETSDIQIVIRQQDNEKRDSLDNFSLAAGGDEEMFASGDRWEKRFGELDGEFQLLVVDESNGEVIHEATHVVE